MSATGQAGIARRRDDCPCPSLHAEVLSVLEGERSLGRATVPADSAPALEGWLDDCGLTVRELSLSSPDEGYHYLSGSDRARLADRPRRHLLYGYAVEPLEALVRAHRDRDNEAIGRLLGYPACCVAADALYAATPFNDYVRVARVSTDADWRLNVFLDTLPLHPERPLKLISHFPCRLSCPASIAIARRRLAIMERHDAADARRLERWMRMPLLLFDDTPEPPGKKVGLGGAVLLGLELGRQVLVTGRIGFGRPPPADLALVGRAAQIVREADGIEMHDASGAPVGTLDADRWLLVRFAS